MRNTKPLAALILTLVSASAVAASADDGIASTGAKDNRTAPTSLVQNPPIGISRPTFTMPGSPQASAENRTFNAGLIITTTESIDGFRIKEYRGIVRGTMVREPTTVQSFKAGFQGMFGGKVHAYITMCEQGRQQAYDAMVQRAQAVGANAVVGMRYDSDAFVGGSNEFGTEVVCYGTAVVIEPKAP